MAPVMPAPTGRRQSPRGPITLPRRSPLDTRRRRAQARGATIEWTHAMRADTDESVNVLGEPLKPCSYDPQTGFFRDGCCNTGPEDRGLHTVCVRVTEEFLAFSRRSGNDLSTPRPEYGFPGLRPGDRWCLCAARWVQALEAGVPPKVILASTHRATLQIVPLEILQAHAMPGRRSAPH